MVPDPKILDLKGELGETFHGVGREEWDPVGLGFTGGGRLGPDSDLSHRSRDRSPEEERYTTKVPDKVPDSSPIEGDERR